MLRHEDIWRALDKLAQEHGLTPSGLARRAGLDATTFNRSKRMSREGKLRWPSTESVAKVLDITNCSLSHLVELISENRNIKAWNPPVIDIGKVIDSGLFGHSGRIENPYYPINKPQPVTNVAFTSTPYQSEPSPHSRANADRVSLDKIDPKKRAGQKFSGLPETTIDDPFAYYLRINELGYEPNFRIGDILIASPSTPIAPGSFVLACLPDGKVHLCQISADATDHGLVIPLIPLLRNHTERLPLSRCEWVVRIVWASL